MSRPLLLDLFCGAGGAAMGYHRAGFDVVGVDIAPQPHYPFEFHQFDALAALADGWGDHRGPWDVAAIHASPPCQDHTRGGSHPIHNTGWMLGATRDLLSRLDVPWIIENIPGAPMRADYVLCGCMFDLSPLERERWFETSWHGHEMRPPCYRSGPAISVTGHGTQAWTRAKLGRNLTIADCRALMGIDWMTRDELSQAIPPAYTEHIGGQLMAHLKGRVA